MHSFERMKCTSMCLCVRVRVCVFPWVSHLFAERIPPCLCLHPSDALSSHCTHMHTSPYTHPYTYTHIHIHIHIHHTHKHTSICFSVLSNLCVCVARLQSILFFIFFVL